MLKQFRKQNQLSQSEAAKSFGVSLSLIKSIEAGRRALPKYIRAHIRTIEFINVKLAELAELMQVHDELLQRERARAVSTRHEHHA